MLEIYKHMKEKNVECDSVLYNTIISGLTFNYQLEEAVNVLYETFKKKIILNNEVYLNVLKNLYKKINSRYATKNDLS